MPSPSHLLLNFPELRPHAVAYTGSVRERILKVLAEMNHLREELNRPPR
jgi:hypothetical protein